MKKSILFLFLTLFISATAVAGIIGNSVYDGVYDVHVVRCDGSTVTYQSCAITNNDEWSIAFIPDQGRIPTGNGKQIIITKTCSTITLVEK